MPQRIPPDVLAYLQRLGKKYGKLGGTTAAKNMTAKERVARAKKASLAAAKQRTAKRLEREPAKNPTRIKDRETPELSGPGVAGGLGHPLE